MEPCVRTAMDQSARWVTATAHATVLFLSVIQSTVFASKLTCQEVRLECDSNKNQ